MFQAVTNDELIPGERERERERERKRVYAPFVCFSTPFPGVIPLVSIAPSPNGCTTSTTITPTIVGPVNLAPWKEYVKARFDT